MPASSSESSGDGEIRIAKHAWEFAQQQTLLAEAAIEARRFLLELAVKSSIDYHKVEARAKSLHSYMEKAERRQKDGTAKYVDPASQIHDCVAARMIVYTTSAREDLVSLLYDEADVIERKNPGKAKRNGYDSEHLVIASLTSAGKDNRFQNLNTFLERFGGLEIQIRSVAGHAWAEYEHDVRYKSPAFDVLAEETKLHIDQLFVEAGGMRRVMDTLFAEIAELMHPGPPSESPTAPETDKPDDGDGLIGTSENDSNFSESLLRDLVAEQFPGEEVGSGEEVPELLHHLTAMQLASTATLNRLITDINFTDVAQLMGYSVAVSGIRRLDDGLLQSLGERYINAATTEARRRILQLRYRRVAGRHNIYSIDVGGGPGALVSAAKALRELVKIVADEKGLDAARRVDGVSADGSDLPPGAKPKLVETINGHIYVVSSLPRTNAEEMMRKLVDQMDGQPLIVRRAGDELFSAHKATTDSGPPSAAE